MATDAVDEVRREPWNETRAMARTEADVIGKAETTEDDDWDF